MLEKPQSWVGDSLVPSFSKFLRIAVKKTQKQISMFYLGLQFVTQSGDDKEAVTATI